MPQAHVLKEAVKPRPFKNSWLICASGSGSNGSMVPCACHTGTLLAACVKLAVRGSQRAHQVGGVWAGVDAQVYESSCRDCCYEYSYLPGKRQRAGIHDDMTSRPPRA